MRYNLQCNEHCVDDDDSYFHSTSDHGDYLPNAELPGLNFEMHCDFVNKQKTFSNDSSFSTKSQKERRSTVFIVS